ncbi:ribonuclease Y [Limnochorda pilosa]|uniref:Ribonuclease Y n=1 Tax=Limnochorda pilosa TaxID=1555112 RepID=A0A0K2SKX7_LIMPI|nr:ribonuclease [Limnochorda pilosa]
MAVASLALMAGYAGRRYFVEGRIARAESAAAEIMRAAEREADSRRREALLELRNELQERRQSAEHELRERRRELQAIEGRLLQREQSLDRRQGDLSQREERLQAARSRVEEIHREIEGVLEEQRKELERIAGLTREEARRQLFEQVERDSQHELAVRLNQLEAQARQEADRRARSIIALSIERLASEYVSESTVSVVPLPSDDMKGRIIGREGRNIRTLETLTGVDLIVDDTPEAVIVSSFDPVRREVARIALERLVADGRIHPARIEEQVGKAWQALDAVIQEAGERAAFEVGVSGLAPELVGILGRLRFRTSYGQNVLQHSIEVAHLAGMMAAELKANAEVARRAGLLHDVGKAVDHEMDGTHVQIGMELLRRYHESPEVIHAMACHHGDYEPQTLEASIVTAADALSAARPGARRESLDQYIRRLENLEALADSFDGVEKAYAIQAGREIRIMVRPDAVDDLAAARLARELARRIETELHYPGQIKVTVIRETRAVAVAR